jgi:hypothetical protein
MKQQKMSLANIQGKLSRDEMKKIMAGAGGKSGSICGLGCNIELDCRGDETGCTKCNAGGAPNGGCGCGK